MGSEGTLLPPGAELRIRADVATLLKAAQTMQVAAKDRAVALGAQLLRLRAVDDGSASPHLLLSCDTGEMTLQIVLEDVDILDTGSISVLLPEFLAKLRAAESTRCEVSVLDAEKILLRTPRTIWQVSGEVGHWDVAEEDRKHLVEIPAARLAKAVAAVLPAVPKNSGRPVLEQVHIADDWAAATNGALLLKQRIGHGELFHLDLPRPVATLVAGLKGGSVEVLRGKKSISLRYPKAEVTIPVPLLPYPDISKIEQAAYVETHGVLIVEPEVMLAALTRVRAYSSPDLPEVVLRTVKTTQGWSVLLTSEDRSGNLTKEALAASWQSEARLHAVFHHAHLAAVLKVLGAEEAEVRISTSGKSLLVEDSERGLLAVAQQIVSRS